MIKVEMNDFELKLDIYSPVKEIADFIRDDIIQNLHQSKDIDGNAVEGLKPSTIKQKKHSKVFFRTGELYRSIISYMQNKNTAIVTVAKRRLEATQYLCEGTDKMPKREFFGIGKKLKSKLDELVNTKTKVNGR